MKFSVWIFFAITVYVGIYFSLTVSNLWILFSAFCIVHLGLFRAYREFLNPNLYSVCAGLHIILIVVLNVYFGQPAV
ncbi:hypothetical protein EHQ12_08135 [Leptospira gomenensis]|uniref:Uncharacterized protein n=1 Tax=Leptospira gomenensis TaxID=2484974 RepID=A0A5F1Z1U4_9LEPT|nr:hypothetical protein [Leptospira gomenensis]TGK35970.1 hypothetical protein EHQ17_05160 [Leptospira gomenensis]TGK39999.1 hypothetical protein EHQ12_08135 [Leptospira gomenensis]TGK51448.1 hypothetical protein EHQ07_02525 [Leptospira gomenensis]TGK68005.1 hypothetical protein EHQ13_01060 [Leptospira gomenensis]